MIPEEEIQKARDKFLDKRVRIKNALGKTTKYDNKDIVGNLQFLGYNEFLPSWELCATVDRMPIQHVKLENIILEQ